MLLGNPPKLPCCCYYYYTTTLQHHPPFTVSHFEAKNGVKTMQCILKFWSDIFETDSTNFSTILQIRLYKSMKNSFWFLLNQSHNSKGEQSAFSQKIMLRYHHQICIDMFFCTLLIQNCSQWLFYLCMCTVYYIYQYIATVDPRLAAVRGWRPVMATSEAVSIDFLIFQPPSSI